MMHTKVMGKWHGLNCILILLLLGGMIGCTSNVEGISESEKEVDEISFIDHKKVEVIDSRSFYSGESDYMDHVVQVLAENGMYLLSALYEQGREKAINTSYTTDLNFVDFGRVMNAKEARKQQRDPSNDPLFNLSSHIRVMDPDGNCEDFELIVTKGADQPGSKQAKDAKNNKWIALDPETFYGLEDGKGQTIWPIQFEAVSVTNPADVMEFELHENGDLNRKEGAKRKSAWVLDEMIYVDPVAILEPECDTCSGDEGSSYSKNYVDQVEFLALKKIRLQSTGDGGNAGEIQMYVSPVDDYSKRYGRKWSFVFDHKWGYVNRPLWFDDFSIVGILEQTASLFQDPRGTILSTAENVFSGRNTRTFGMDYRIYQTPDVNYSGRDYYFTDMRNWSYIRNNIIGDSYVESTNSLDYFPIAPLLSYGTFRVVMADNDHDYPEASALRESVVDHDVWTFNMQRRSYEKLYTQIDADRHLIGKTDDILPRSGLRKINMYNVDRVLLYTDGSYYSRFDNFIYGLVKVRRSVELKPA